MSDQSTSYAGLNEDEHEEKDYSLQHICPIIFNNKRSYEFLVEKGVLQAEMRCSAKSCRRAMTVEADTRLSDGAAWRCRICRTYVSRYVQYEIFYIIAQNHCAQVLFLKNPNFRWQN